MDDVKVKEPKTKKSQKLEPPKEYQVVLNNQCGIMAGCDAAVLMDVFNFSALKARDLAFEAACFGRSIIYTSPMDIAETKALQANEAKDWHSNHNPVLNNLDFTAEPAV